jgi:hypothetical protein
MDETRTRRDVSSGAVIQARVGAFNVLDGIAARTNPTGVHRSAVLEPTNCGSFVTICHPIRFLSGVAVPTESGPRCSGVRHA